MKIYSMTATFGSLEHKTLTLQPGLNIIEAPNEWGKSTWCAFLVNMLYGLDTRAKSTKTALADKDRYAPWSGAPMAGRIDLNWNGRDITIERNTRGRLIFGEFSAYETATGLEVPELNGSNCGTVLLGVERSVFTRSGFLKLTDLPVTQDDALRRRLNNLVTTGDESGAGDKLQQSLKDLKNKCRYNRSGLLPQAEAQRDQLEGQLGELDHLSQQCQSLRNRQTELEERIGQLENHKAHLRYTAALEDSQKLEQAVQAEQEAMAVYTSLAQNCEGLPSREAAEEAIHTGQQLQQQWMSLQMEGNMLPPAPQAPEIPAPYRQLDADKVVDSAKEDHFALTRLETDHKRRSRILTGALLACSVILAAMAVLYFGFSLGSSVIYLCAGGAIILGVLLLFGLNMAATKRFRAQAQILYDRHPGLASNLWVEDAQAFAAQRQAYTQALEEHTALRGDFDQRLESLNRKVSDFAQDESLAQCLDRWQQIREAWNALADATRDWKQAQNHLDTLRSMVKTVEKPLIPDSLTDPESETDAYLNSARFELRQLQQKLGQAQGRSEALGQESVLRTQLKAVNHRIHKLEDTYAALELAQKALSAASAELQRRFAPRISKRAQELFCKLTGQRYDRLTLSEDLSLNTCTAEEDTLRPAQWRSDGTVDQLYLALRLAVAEELTPDAPLILDDALVRFDDKRLETALDILKETAQNKQVILFTCQGRESKYQGATL